MIRAIAIVIYLYAWLIITYPYMLYMKSISKRNNPADDFRLMKFPTRWSKGIVKITGSKVRIEGLENIPEGQVVFVGNHKSYMDIFTLVEAVGEVKPVGFVAKIELKKIPILNKWMSIMGSPFLDREDRRGSLQVMKDGIKRVKDGHSLVIFPEGTRRGDDTFGDFKGGSLRLAKDGDASIVPFVLYGTADVFENNGNRVFPADVVLKFLPSIENSCLHEKELNEVAAEIKADVERNYFAIKEEFITIKKN